VCKLTLIRHFFRPARPASPCIFILEVFKNIVPYITGNRTGQIVKPQVVIDRVVAWVVPSCLGKSSDSCLGYRARIICKDEPGLE
jgi:hypothetical protein